MSASKPRSRFIRWLWIPLLPFFVIALALLAIFLWHLPLPSATVHYPKEGGQELQYTWNVKDRIYRGQMRPGGAVSDYGFLSPDSEFFMEFSWRREKDRWHCISVTPKWPNTHIYLDAEGNIDSGPDSGTDIDRLKECQWDLAKP
ncbi:hypothetical protein ACVNP3_11740 [Pseudomonas chlororaphis subsp. piscium]|uniref:hypothetical protein n=1 Tax=Pseudomonas chlororaphis TaxID=587753 RepID=UPI001CB9D765|nr:hypothetical protein [Pseudomonas chlororaphis]